MSGGVPGRSGRIQNIFEGSCALCHTSLLLYKIKNFSLSYDTFQPALHSIFMETKEVWDRTVTMCDRVAELGSHGRSNLPVCVD